MEPVDISFKSLLGLTTIISEQENLLQSLASLLRALLVMEGPLPPTVLSLDGPEWVVKSRCVSSSCSLFQRAAGRYSARLLQLCTITVFIH
jgi:hypothetical protein